MSGIFLKSVCKFINIPYTSKCAHFSLDKQCIDPLGMEDGHITDDQLTATDYFVWSNPDGSDDIYSPQYARLNWNWAWATHIRDTNQWIEVASEETWYITGIITQGFLDGWIKTYKVEYTGDGTNWQYVTEISGEEKVCLIL